MTDNNLISNSKGLFEPRRLKERELSNINSQIETLDNFMKRYPRMTNTVKVLLKILYTKKNELENQIK